MFVVNCSHISSYRSASSWTTLLASVCTRSTCEESSTLMVSYSYFRTCEFILTMDLITDCVPMMLIPDRATPTTCWRWRN